MSRGTAPQSPDADQSLTTVKTIHLLGMLSIASIALAWANNEFVMTKDVFYALAGATADTSQVDVQYETVRRMGVWGYMIAPLQSLCRIGFAALVLQMSCLIGGIEIPYSKLFRVAAVAFFAVLFGSLLQIGWIVLQPAAAITKASLGIVPDSLAAWFATPGDAQSLLQLVGSRVSVTALLWGLLVYWGLRETNGIEPAGAALVALAAWCVISVLKVVTALFVRGLVS